MEECGIMPHYSVTNRIMEIMEEVVDIKIRIKEKGGIQHKGSNTNTILDSLKYSSIISLVFQAIILSNIQAIKFSNDQEFKQSDNHVSLQSSNYIFVSCYSVRNQLGYHHQD